MTSTCYQLCAPDHTYETVTVQIYINLFGTGLHKPVWTHSKQFQTSFKCARADTCLLVMYVAAQMGARVIILYIYVGEWVDACMHVGVGGSKYNTTDTEY